MVLGLTLLSAFVERRFSAQTQNMAASERRFRDLSPASPEIKNLRVLLAEDNVINQTIAVRALEKRGHVVTVAQNGQAALDACAAQSFDLILMDIQMPGMDGLESHRRDSQTGNFHRRAHADYCHDRSCVEGRPGTLPRSRNGRLRLQANPHHRTICRHGKRDARLVRSKFKMNSFALTKKQPARICGVNITERHLGTARRTLPEILLGAHF
jgi:hypothetical protein